MKNHTYIFNKEIRLQMKGGAIGVDLTGIIAQIFMSWWDKEMNKKLKSLKIDVMLYERYVDDINICIKATNPRSRYVEDKLEICDDEVGAEENIPEDKRTMNI